jgi:hypothetical protein
VPVRVTFDENVEVTVDQPVMRDWRMTKAWLHRALT